MPKPNLLKFRKKWFWRKILRSDREELRKTSFTSSNNNNIKENINFSLRGNKIILISYPSFDIIRHFRSNDEYVNLGILSV